MARDLAIVLNNGSVNSAVITALAAQKYRPIMLFAGAMPNPSSRAKQAYDMQVGHFKPYREHSVAMPFLDDLHQRIGIEQAGNDPRQPTLMGPQLTQLIPLVGAAAAYAAHYAATAVYLGLRTGPGTDELAQATEYVQIWSELLQQPCGFPELDFVTPLLELEPWQVVDVGFQVNAPLERTWSCVDDSAEPCWACKGCRGRELAFQQAGKGDPLRVVAKKS